MAGQRPKSRAKAGHGSYEHNTAIPNGHDTTVLEAVSWAWPYRGRIVAFYRSYRGRIEAILNLPISKVTVSIIITKLFVLRSASIAAKRSKSTGGDQSLIVGVSSGGVFLEKKVATRSSLNSFYQVLFNLKLIYRLY